MVSNFEIFGAQFRFIFNEQSVFVEDFMFFMKPLAQLRLQSVAMHIESLSSSDHITPKAICIVVASIWGQ